MIWSAAKKKIDANATMTNTMIVVIVVSRRVGQVTLAVSARTSCRNLNGLKAIEVPRPRPDEIYHFVRGSEQQPSHPALSRRMSRKAGSLVRGFLNAAPDIRVRRAGCRWPVCTAMTIKGQDRIRSTL